MTRPESPTQTDIIEYDTKSLKDTRVLLEKVELNEATQFIELNPHQRLWQVLHKKNHCLIIICFYIVFYFKKAFIGRKCS